MYQGLLHLHNFGRWVVLSLLLIAVLKSLIGMAGNKSFNSADNKTALFLMISAHIMLLVGLYQWFAGPGLGSIQNMGMKAAMQNSVARFWAVEHPLGMIIGIILITMGRASAKKKITDKAKHTRSFWFYFIALLIIVASVPWPFREVARPLFPGT
ncbi:MAG: hypothetical protein JWQ40_3403 [Segetibacter sp.]|nr:hypothetical protein [Segetibacter sp.]